MKSNYYLSDSNIHGKGVFVSKTFKKGEPIAIGIEFWFYCIPMITSDFGSYINHSYKPSCKLEWDNRHQAWYVVCAKSKLRKGSEITVDYRDTPWYIKNPEPHFK